MFIASGPSLTPVILRCFLGDKVVCKQQRPSQESWYAAKRSNEHVNARFRLSLMYCDWIGGLEHSHFQLLLGSPTAYKVITPVSRHSLHR